MAIVKGYGSRMHLILGLSIAFALIISGSIACQQAEENLPEEPAALEEGKLVFEGTPKLAIGRFLFLPEAQGFDIVVQGAVDGGDLTSLVGQEVRVEGEITPEQPAVLIANTIEVKEANGEYRSVFTRTDEPALDEYLDLQARAAFEALDKLKYDENTGWEGKERAKVYGSLEQMESGYRILVLDEKGEQVGFVLVDSISDYANFYLQKLPLFDKFWFYLDVKETIEWSARRRSSELFHADVLFAGLF
jgi:hypothetical protein